MHVHVCVCVCVCAYTTKKHVRDVLCRFQRHRRLYNHIHSGDDRYSYLFMPDNNKTQLEYSFEIQLFRM